jgi:hypothetical protein
MQAVLELLRALEREHCELTVDEIQRRFSTAQTMSQQVVDTQQRELRERYLKDERAKQQREAAAAVVQRTCCICYGEVPVDQGIECGANDGTPHFVCNDCLANHVLTESEKDLHDVRERNGQVYCPLRLHGCSSKTPYVVIRSATSTLYKRLFRIPCCSPAETHGSLNCNRNSCN